MENKVCVYAICKNESQFVDRWINSMKEADYIVVVDTGSEDDTVIKLLAHQKELSGSKLIVEQKVITPWRFDKARNESLRVAYSIPDANIFVCMDLDEIIEPGWADILRKEWNDKYERVSYKYTWSHTKSGAEGRSFNQTKIHKRGWIWYAPVHEFLVRESNMKPTYSYEETLNIFDRMHVQHYPDDKKSRSSYLPLLKLRLEENPDDLVTQMYLGHEYYYKGFYKESIDTLNGVLTKLPNTGIDSASCYLFIGDCYKQLGDIKNAIASYYKSIYTDNTYIEPYIALGHVYHDLKKYKLAISIVKEGIENAVRQFSWLERDKSWSYEPWDLLSLASYYSGDKKSALAYAIKAYSFDQEDERLLNNINEILKYSSNIELL